MAITYKEYKEKRQAEFNALPLHWAFSDEQFEEICEQTGASGPEDFYHNSSPGGCFYLKSDADTVHEWMDRPDPLPELLKDYDFAFGAFLYEMGNHEYFINWQADWDVMSCFTNIEYKDESTAGYLKRTGWCDATKRAYLDARKEFYKQCEENGWW